MSKKTLYELEQQMQRLKERQLMLKDELAAQRKAAEARAVKERNHKLLCLGEIVTEITGDESVLEYPERLKSFLLAYQSELCHYILQNDAQTDTKQTQDAPEGFAYVDESDTDFLLSSPF